MTTVCGVGRGDRERLAADEHRVAERAARLLVVDGLEREQHVGRRERRAVGELHAAAQVQRAREAVGRAGVRLGQPRLELLRGAVDADEARLRQQAVTRLRREVAAGVRVERARLAAHRGDQRAAARGRAWPAPWVSQSRPGRVAAASPSGCAHCARSPVPAPRHTGGGHQAGNRDAHPPSGHTGHPSYLAFGVSARRGLPLQPRLPGAGRAHRAAEARAASASPWVAEARAASEGE